jgi:hypothetical protein
LAGLNGEREQIIPTRYRTRIPHTLSYPVGAKAISEALIGVPQFGELAAEFWFWNQLARHHGTATPYRVMQVQYSGPKRFFSASKSMEEKGHYSPSWKIIVDAVPRSLRHLIQGKIIAEVLPSIRAWLLANPVPTKREGSHGLVFVVDELNNEMKCDESTSLEWHTTRIDKPH